MSSNLSLVAKKLPKFLAAAMCMYIFFGVNACFHVFLCVQVSVNNINIAVY